MALWLREGEIQQRAEFIMAILPIISGITLNKTENLALCFLEPRYFPNGPTFKFKGPSG